MKRLKQIVNTVTLTASDIAKFAGVPSSALAEIKVDGATDGDDETIVLTEKSITLVVTWTESQQASPAEPSLENVLGLEQGKTFKSASKPS